MSVKRCFELIKEKVFGITGDGAFTKGNAPSKSRASDLFGKTLTYQWDLLHLMNRSHEEARGKVKKKEYESGSSESESEINSDIILSGNASKKKCTDIFELIMFIQKSAKKNRTGIKYTQ